MKSHTILIILVIIAAFALLSFNQIFSKPSEVDAKKFFEEDLAQSYPNADVLEIISVQKSADESKDLYILKARVSSGLKTVCPERIEVEYHYPSRNFVKEEDRIVYGCQVCVDNKQNCHISYMEEAIIASHTYGKTEEVKSYISNYPNAVASVNFIENYNQIKNVWHVRWESTDSPYYIDVYLPQSGESAILVEKSQKA